MEYTLTKGQELALQSMIEGKNVFLTGEAGSGKSTVIHEFIEFLGKMKTNYIVVAPTGTAAINVSGSTIHRVFQAKTGPLVDHVIKKVPKVVVEAEIIIIDEISMCRVDLFDYVSNVIRAAEARAGKRKQIILVGDFFQLPPVTGPKDRIVLNDIYSNYGAGYAFESDNWDAFDFETAYLKEIVRQSDEEFISNLNLARIGDTSCIEYFNRKSLKEKSDKSITLCSTKDDVKRINQEELKLVQGRRKIYKGIVEGKFSKNDMLSDENLGLKLDARVIILVNDNVNHAYKNGSLGYVVELKDDSISVLLDDTGEEVELTWHTWNSYSYELQNEFDDSGMLIKKLKKKTIGSFTQLPVQLAYALTIHRSQGKTFNNINLIPNCFSPGQLYVALSRVRSIEGMTLLQTMTHNSLKTNDKVLQFYDLNVSLSKEARKKIDVFSKRIFLMDKEDIIENQSKIIEEIIKLKLELEI